MKKLILYSIAIVLLTNSCRKKDDPDVIEYALDNTLKGTISSARTLINTSAVIDYYISGEVIAEAALTIDPGVVIVALSGSSLEFSGPQSALISLGTAAAPIIIRSEQGLRGAWKGIRFSGSNNAQNNLVHTSISDGGSASFNGDATEKANIRLANTTQIRMKNCVINNSAAYGIYSEKFDDLTIVEFQNNSFTNNADFPIYTTDQNIASLGTSSTFNGNTKNYVAMVQKDFNGLLGDVIWYKQAAPYLFNDADGLTLGYYTTNGGLTLEAGVTLFMGAGSLIFVGGNSNNTGYLKINGTAAEPVTISGLNNLKGSWNGILISTSSVNNVWNYANINDGGASAFLSGINKANVCIGQFGSDDANLSVTNCTSNNSLGCGYTTAIQSSGSITQTGTLTGTNNTSAVSCTH